MDVTALLQLKDQLINTAPALFFLGGFERILTMICHLAMSLIVCHGVYSGNAAKSAMVCLGIHTVIDLTAGISLMIGNGLSQATAYIIIYTLLTIAAVLSVLVIRNIRRQWKETEE